MPRDEKKHCRKGSGSKGRDGGVHGVHAQGIGILDGGCALKCEFLVKYIYSHIHTHICIQNIYIFTHTHIYSSICVLFHGFAWGQLYGSHIYKTINLSPKITFN